MIIIIINLLYNKMILYAREMTGFLFSYEAATERHRLFRNVRTRKYCIISV